METQPMTTARAVATPAVSRPPALCAAGIFAHRRHRRMASTQNTSRTKYLLDSSSTSFVSSV
jgi:hypothetical protein